MPRKILLAIQHLLAMVGATILVPILTGFDPSVALFTGGLGTLVYAFVTKRKIPAYLGSSFAVIGGMVAAKQTLGPEAALFGIFALGIAYVVISLVIGAVGTKWLDRVFPPVVVGPVVAVIGLSLAGVAVKIDAGWVPDAVTHMMHWDQVIVSVITLIAVLVFNTWFKGIWRIIPVLLGFVVGYLVAIPFGLVNFKAVQDAAWIGLPHFNLGGLSHVSWPAAALLVPVVLVLVTEHIGHLLVTEEIVGQPLTKDPGLHRSLLGDGLSCMIAGALGGPAATTYGENIGVMAITKNYDVTVFMTAAVIAILLGFVAKLGALISTIPAAVIGGVSIVLFGVIASTGLRLMIERKVNMISPRNLMVAAVILIVGVGGPELHAGGFTFDGLTLATILGVVLNLVLPNPKDEVAAH